MDPDESAAAADVRLEGGPLGVVEDVAAGVEEHHHPVRAQPGRGEGRASSVDSTVKPAAPAELGQRGHAGRDALVPVAAVKPVPVADQGPTGRNAPEPAKGRAAYPATGRGCRPRNSAITSPSLAG